jgi:hypothetical protein
MVPLGLPEFFGEFFSSGCSGPVYRLVTLCFCLSRMLHIQNVFPLLSFVLRGGGMRLFKEIYPYLLRRPSRSILVALTSSSSGLIGSCLLKVRGSNSNTKLFFHQNVRELRSSWGGDGLAVNMSRQHVCVLRVRVPLPRRGVFWHLTWRTESLDRGLILVCRFSFVSSRECIPVAAQTRSCLQGWMHVRNPLLPPNG